MAETDRSRNHCGGADRRDLRCIMSLDLIYPAVIDNTDVSL